MSGNPEPLEAGRANIGELYYIPAVGVPCRCDGLSSEKDGDGTRLVTFVGDGRTYQLHPSVNVAKPRSGASGT